jgi:hypothetical protein
MSSKVIKIDFKKAYNDGLEPVIIRLACLRVYRESRQLLETSCQQCLPSYGNLNNYAEIFSFVTVQRFK